MKQILFILFTAALTLIGCLSVKKGNSPVVKQGFTGLITSINGNQMPMKGVPPVTPKGMVATVLIYEPTNITQVTRIGTSPVYTAISTQLVASAVTDSTGSFTVSLAPGNYSVFIRQNNWFYANLFDTNNNIALFTVEEGKLTKVNLSVNSSATY